MERKELIFSKSLPFELTNGNEGRSKKYFASNDARKRFHADLIVMGLKRAPFDTPVIVHVIRLLGKGQKYWDSSSGLRGNYKELEDALVAVGWFHDDSYKCIPETRFFQERAENGKPGIRLEVYRLA